MYVIWYQDAPKKHWIKMPKTWTLERAEKRVTYYKYLSPGSKFRIEEVNGK